MSEENEPKEIEPKGSRIFILLLRGRAVAGACGRRNPVPCL